MSCSSCVRMKSPAAAALSQGILFTIAKKRKEYAHEYELMSFWKRNFSERGKSLGGLFGWIEFAFSFEYSVATMVCTAAQSSGDGFVTLSFYDLQLLQDFSRKWSVSFVEIPQEKQKFYEGTIPLPDVNCDHIFADGERCAWPRGHVRGDPAKTGSDKNERWVTLQSASFLSRTVPE